MKKCIHYFLFFLLLCTSFGSCVTSTGQSGFVKSVNGQFMLNGRPHYFMGANYWYGSILPLKEEGKKRLQQELDFLQENNVNNLRIMVAAEGEGLVNGKIRVEPAYQKTKGNFDDKLLIGLDYLLVEMGKRNMKAVLFLSNNWEWSGGFLQYLNWADILPDSIMRRKLTWDENRDWVSKFYSSTDCMEAYSKQVESIVARTNSITGKAYKDDPAIFSWQLANEPRPMRPSAIPAYLEWTKKSAELIKRLDPNHMVSTGCEGRMGVENLEVFEGIHKISSIDYATIHIWPKNWGWFSDTTIFPSIGKIVSSSNAYIDEHTVICKKLRKPLVIEEFGLPRDGHVYQPTASVNLRNQYFASIFSQCAESAKSGGIIGGYNFWAFSGFGKASGKTEFFTRGDDLLGDPPQEEQGLNSVFSSDETTWQLIRKYNYATHK